MHQHPRATLQPLAPKSASRSAHRARVSGFTVSSMAAIVPHPFALLTASNGPKEVRMRVILGLFATLLLASCDLRYAVMGFPLPVPKLAKALPIELEYREAKGGL